MSRPASRTHEHIYAPHRTWATHVYCTVDGCGFAVPAAVLGAAIQHGPRIAMTDEAWERCEAAFGEDKAGMRARAGLAFAGTLAFEVVAVPDEQLDAATGEPRAVRVLAGGVS
jgi:hypothetical protein